MEKADRSNYPYQNFNSEKDMMIEKMRLDMQGLQTKLVTAEFDANRAKESENNMNESYTTKIKKLEKKVNEMSEAMHEH